MLFAKDLGPVAQNITKRKFLGCEIFTTSTSAPCKIERHTFNTVTNHLDNVPCYPNTISPKDNVEKEKGCNPSNGNTWGCYKWPIGCDKEFLSKRFCFKPCYS